MSGITYVIHCIWYKWCIQPVPHHLPLCLTRPWYVTSFSCVKWCHFSLKWRPIQHQCSLEVEPDLPLHRRYYDLFKIKLNGEYIHIKFTSFSIDFVSSRLSRSLIVFITFIFTLIEVLYKPRLLLFRVLIIVYLLEILFVASFNNLPSCLI